MSEPLGGTPPGPHATDASPAPAPAAAATAGGLLRQARQARGLHIAALAAAIKVTPQKLEALEADRFGDLPGATFTRALAQTVCRTLKIDAGPVLALLPSTDGGIEKMSRGLNEPFRDRPGRQPPTEVLAVLKSPVVAGAIALVVLAGVVLLLPAGWVTERLRFAPAAPATPASGTVTEVVPLSNGAAAPAEPVLPEGAASEIVFPAAGPGVDAAPATPPGSAVGASLAPVVTLPASAAAAGAITPPPAGTAASAPSATGALRLRATAESWVEVTDRRGVRLLSRMLQPGESVALDGAAPLRVRIGNAAVTEVAWQGAPVDLARATSRGNVATLELP